jgi:hypothetical protein
MVGKLSITDKINQTDAQSMLKIARISFEKGRTSH